MGRAAKESADAARDLQERLASLALKLDGVSRKNMFGYPYYFHQGNAVVGLMGANALFYLDAAASAEFLTMPSTRRWAFGDAQAGWYVLQNAAAHEDAVLETWLKRALAYVATLPPTPGRQRATKPTRTDGPATQQRTTKQTSTKQTSTKQTSTKQTSTKQTSTKQTSTKRTSTKQTSANQTSANQTSAKQTTANQTSTKQTTAKQTSTKQTTAKQPSKARRGGGR